MNFYEFWQKIDEVLEFGKASKVRHRLLKQPGKKRYRPNTFGVELEFRAWDGEVDKEWLKWKLGENEQVDAEVDESAPPDPDDWVDENPEPDLDQYLDGIQEDDRERVEEKYEEDLAAWKRSYVDVRAAARDWNDGDKEGAKERLIQQIIRDENWEDYNVNYENGQESVDDKVYNYISMLKKLGENAIADDDATETTWACSPDETGVAEIRSRHLSTADFPLLLQLLKELQYEETDANTSAHVHVGLDPDETDAFDLLAMTTLVDENEVLNQIDGHRDLGCYANLRDTLYTKVKILFPPGTYDNQNALGRVSSLAKYMGTNVSAFFTHGTVEFRYLSSQVIDDPKKFCEWIQYYLMIPRLARSKKQIICNNLVFTRLPGGKIQVTEGNRPKPPEGSPDDLRQPMRPMTAYDRYYMEKFGDRSIACFLWHLPLIPRELFMKDVLKFSLKIGSQVEDFAKISHYQPTNFRPDGAPYHFNGLAGLNASYYIKQVLNKITRTNLQDIWMDLSWEWKRQIVAIFKQMGDK